MMTSVESSRSSNLKDFLSTRFKMTLMFFISSPNLKDFFSMRFKIPLMFFIIYCSPSSFVGDSSQSSFTRMDCKWKGKPPVCAVEGRLIAGDSGDIEIGPVGDNPRPRGALAMLLTAERCNQNRPKLTT